MVQAVIFDLDGCLVDSEVLSLAAIADEAERLGAGRITMPEMAREILGLQMPRIGAWIAARGGRNVPGDFAARIDTALMALYPDKLRAVAGATELLRALEGQGVRMAVATGSAAPRMRLALEVTGLAGFFSGSACSADAVARGKPAPDLFLHAAEVIGQRPDTCLVLEDSPHGVEGALSAGMRVVGFVGGGHLEGLRDDHGAVLRRAGCHAIVRDLSDFQRIALEG